MPGRDYNHAYSLLEHSLRQSAWAREKNNAPNRPAYGLGLPTDTYGEEDEGSISSTPPTPPPKDHYLLQSRKNRLPASFASQQRQHPLNGSQATSLFPPRKTSLPASALRTYEPFVTPVNGHRSASQDLTALNGDSTAATPLPSAPWLPSKTNSPGAESFTTAREHQSLESLSHRYASIPRHHRNFSNNHRHVFSKLGDDSWGEDTDSQRMMQNGLRHSSAPEPRKGSVPLALLEGRTRQDSGHITPDYPPPRAASGTLRRKRQKLSEGAISVPGTVMNADLQPAFEPTASPHKDALEQFRKDIGWPDSPPRAHSRRTSNQSELRRSSVLSTASSTVSAVVVDHSPPQRKHPLRHTTKTDALRKPTPVGGHALATQPPEENITELANELPTTSISPVSRRIAASPNPVVASKRQREFPLSPTKTTVELPAELSSSDEAQPRGRFDLKSKFYREPVGLKPLNGAGYQQIAESSQERLAGTPNALEEVETPRLTSAPLVSTHSPPLFGATPDLRSSSDSRFHQSLQPRNGQGHHRRKSSGVSTTASSKRSFLSTGDTPPVPHWKGGSPGRQLHVRGSSISTKSEVPEVNEATTVSIFPHNNESLVLVNGGRALPVDQGFSPDNGLRLFTLQSRNEFDEAVEESPPLPLENPRQPPEPPVGAHHGVTEQPSEPQKSSTEREETTQDTSRRPSLLSRARRYSDDLIASLKPTNLRKKIAPPSSFPRHKFSISSEKRLHRSSSLPDNLTRAEDGFDPRLMGVSGDGVVNCMPPLRPSRFGKTNGSSAGLPQSNNLIAEPPVRRRSLRDRIASLGGIKVGDSHYRRASDTETRRNRIGLPARIRTGLSALATRRNSPTNSRPATSAGIMQSTRLGRRQSDFGSLTSHTDTVSTIRAPTSTAVPDISISPADVRAGGLDVQLHAGSRPTSDVPLVSPMTDVFSADDSNIEHAPVSPDLPYEAPPPSYHFDTVSAQDESSASIPRRVPGASRNFDLHPLSTNLSNSTAVDEAEDPRLSQISPMTTHVGHRQRTGSLSDRGLQRAMSAHTEEGRSVSPATMDKWERSQASFLQDMQRKRAERKASHTSS